ncbi:MAG: hypothetical protein ACYDEB_08655 [Dehalococcoidia bacterium]
MRPYALPAAVATGIVAIVMQAPLLGVPRATEAAPLTCSAGDPWDPVAHSDVIVAGRIRGYTVLSDVASRGMFLPIELRFDVDRTLKGTLGPTDRVVDVASLLPAPADDPTHRPWAGSAGACGALNHDPTGWYAVLGLHRADDGTLQTNLLTTFYLRPEPYTAANLAALHARLGLPATGIRAPLDERASMFVLVASLAAMTGVVTALGGCALRRPGRPDL